MCFAPYCSVSVGVFRQKCRRCYSTFLIPLWRQVFFVGQGDPPPPSKVTLHRARAAAFVVVMINICGPQLPAKPRVRSWPRPLRTALRLYAGRRCGAGGRGRSSGGPDHEGVRTPHGFRPCVVHGVAHQPSLASRRPACHRQVAQGPPTNRDPHAHAGVDLHAGVAPVSSAPLPHPSYQN